MKSILTFTLMWGISLTLLWAFILLSAWLFLQALRIVGAVI